MSLRVEVGTAAQMRELGSRLAGLLAAGDLVVLSGPLGAGKTVLTQGIAAGLGIPAGVTSPTFVLARVHRGGRLPLVHVDAYRLHLATGEGTAPSALVDDLDLDADVADSVTVVEWGEGLAERLAEDRLAVSLARPAAGDGRSVTIAATGSRWAGVDVAAALR